MTMPNRYDIGDIVVVRAIFSDADGTLVDPTAVYFTVKNPFDISITYEYGENDELTRTETGRYEVPVEAAEDGDYWCRFYSTGSHQAAGERRFRVKVSQVL